MCISDQEAAQATFLKLRLMLSQTDTKGQNISFGILLDDPEVRLTEGIAGIAIS